MTSVLQLVAWVSSACRGREKRKNICIIDLFRSFYVTVCIDREIEVFGIQYLDIRKKFYVYIRLFKFCFASFKIFEAEMNRVFGYYIFRLREIFIVLFKFFVGNGFRKCMLLLLNNNKNCDYKIFRKLLKRNEMMKLVPYF